MKKSAAIRTALRAGSYDSLNSPSARQSVDLDERMFDEMRRFHGSTGARHDPFLDAAMRWRFWTTAQLVQLPISAGTTALSAGLRWSSRGRLQRRGWREGPD